MVTILSSNRKLIMTVMILFVYLCETIAVKWDKNPERKIFTDDLTSKSENVTGVWKWQDLMENQRGRRTYKKKYRPAGSSRSRDEMEILVPKRLSETERLVKLPIQDLNIQENLESKKTTTQSLIRSKFFESGPDEARLEPSMKSVREKHRNKAATNEEDAMSISKSQELFAKTKSKRSTTSTTMTTKPLLTKDDKEKNLQLHINLDSKKTEKIYNEILRERESNIEDESAGIKNIKVRSKIKQHGKSALRSTRMPEMYQLQEEERHMTNEPSSSNSEEVESLSPYAIFHQMQLFAEGISKTHGANVTVSVLDRTAEYNNIVLIKMSAIPPVYRTRKSKFEDEAPEKKIVLIVHGLTVMGMSYLIDDNIMFNTLMNYYMKHLDKFDIFVIPMANPDGYAATVNKKADKFWNKNKSPQSGCLGVALDRNFDVAWNNSVKMSSCSPVYPGPQPFSEVETRAIRDVLHVYGHKIEAYIHVHASSFNPKVFKGDAILYPRGYSDTHIDDDSFLDLRAEVEEAMKNASFRVLSVTVDSLYNWYGPVSGTSVDYAYKVYGIPFAMEFAMQIYDTFEELQTLAMQQIWGRLIPLVFQNIWKNVNSTTNELLRKSY